MKKILFTIVLLFISYLSVSAQKEVYFNTTKSEDIKVESLQGFSVGTGIDFLSLVQNFTSDYKSYSFPLGIGYFYEKRMAPRWTLTSSVTLSNNIIYRGHFFLSNGDSVDRILYYRLGLDVSIAPKWYFGYKHRYQAGKASLNSGWYLSLPVGAGTILLNTMPSNYVNYVGIGAGLAVGYRQAISKQWFLDGSVSLLGISSSLYSINKELYISSPYISYPTGIGLSAAYTFK
ncbi:MAG TPA: hypothetical protein VIK55_11570 [Paludibacter sp.]